MRISLSTYIDVPDRVFTTGIYEELIIEGKILYPSVRNIIVRTPTKRVKAKVIQFRLDYKDFTNTPCSVFVVEPLEIKEIKRK